MMEHKGKMCPLLQDPESYNPDTIDLNDNAKERDYWLPTLEKMVKKALSKAKMLNPEVSKADENAEICYEKFHKLIEEISDNPYVIRPLSVRTLLECNEEILRAHNFKDFWALQKQKESAAALKEFPNRIRLIDEISNSNEKWLELAKGILAGNIFDWGARAVVDILEIKNDFSLSHAIETIEKRPWFHDNLDNWIAKVEERPYNTAMVFVDNAGVDFILGVLPFIRELLIQGSRIILCGNSLPSLNDVTYQDLQLYTYKAAQDCEVLAKALVSKELLLVENGQKGPCLDLSNITPELCDLMTSVDLVILEGMARAVHTNLYAKFKVDSLKVAVLKNEWLAKSLGARQFSVIFDYERVS